MTAPVSLGAAQARRVALAAQGFLDPRHAVPTMRTFQRTLARTGVLQVDSVNVLERAHYMPLYSRMGPYDRTLVDRAQRSSARSPRRLVEYWAHVQALMPVELWPVMQHRMAEHRARRGKWGFVAEAPELEANLLAEVLNRPTPPLADANRELVRRAARSHGVATGRCLRDYYRMHVRDVRPAIEELVEDGELLPATIAGWTRPAYLHRDARLPRRIDARAVLSPFDPVVWERERAERLFGFRYRIEIYVPVEQRVHGYYVLPFLLGDRIAARVDLKADRRAGRLVVKAAYAEPGAPPDTAAHLLAELEQLAGWLCLADVTVEPRGDLAAALLG